MSISSAFNYARSGLTTTEQRARLVAGNIANAQTAGYTRREGMQVSSGGAEGSTVELRMMRQMDERLASMSRGASAAVGEGTVTNEILRGYLMTLGEPGDEVSPAARLAEFQAGLDLLANNPSDPAAQNDLLTRAQGLAHSINTAAGALSDSREAAEAAFATSVTEVNDALSDIAGLNERLRLVGANDGDAINGLMDEMNRRLDALGTQMDFTTRKESDGSITLFTTGGTELVHGENAVRLTADTTTGALMANGVDITPNSPTARGSDSGRLAGLSQLLAKDLPRMKLQLDELARGLVQSFEAADASLGPGDAGLFTDAGNPFDPLQLDGLAGRLAVNDSVNPERGGALWRLRAGVAAAGPGDPGATGQVNAFIDIFETGFAFDAATGLTSNSRIGDFAANMVGHQNTVRVEADVRAESARLRLVTFEGVNIDTELQKLMEIEQSYGANSQVLSSLTEMIDTLLASV